MKALRTDGITQKEMDQTKCMQTITTVLTAENQCLHVAPMRSSINTYGDIFDLSGVMCLR